MRRTQRKTGRKVRRTRRRAVARKNINRRMHGGGALSIEQKNNLLSELAALETELTTQAPKNKNQILKKVEALKISIGFQSANTHGINKQIDVLNQIYLIDTNTGSESNQKITTIIHLV